jgi:UDP-N-acetylmuramate--alanine ligase
VSAAGLPVPALDERARVHLVGIGGSGMAALGQLCAERGVVTSGSDLRGGEAVERLRRAGARVEVGHDAAHLGDADVVVVSNAVPGDNPELVAARERGLPVLLRAELLELLMAGHRRVLVTGTHGKTTTTAMAVVALDAAGLDPSFAVGGTLPGGGRFAGASGRHGAGGVFVAEADEAFRSFLRLTPDVAVVTNLEMDHHDEYADEAAYAAAFDAFLARRTAGAPAVLCADDPGTAALAARAEGPVVTYGTVDGAAVRLHDLRATGAGSRFDLVEGPAGGGERLATVELAVPGRHNALDAAAALLAVRAVAPGAVEAAAAGLRGFTGAARRFQRVGEAAGVAVVDDYGHHPTEVAATIAAARDTAPSRVVAVFQPHRYSRTAAMGEDLGRALVGADLVVVAGVYAAGEAPIPGADAALVARAAAGAGADVRLVDVPEGLDAVLEVLRDLVRPGDLVLTLGAGDVTALGPRLLGALGGGRG